MNSTSAQHQLTTTLKVKPEELVQSGECSLPRTEFSRPSVYAAGTRIQTPSLCNWAQDPDSQSMQLGPGSRLPVNAVRPSQRSRAQSTQWGPGSRLPVYGARPRILTCAGEAGAGATSVFSVCSAHMSVFHIKHDFLDCTLNLRSAGHSESVN